MIAYAETTAKVSGHTESVGVLKLNEILSLARARATAEALIISYNIERSRIIDIQGFTDGKKVIETNGPEARNRRVETYVTPIERSSIQVK